MFMDPGRTQFDLNFRLFGIPVRVHPFFWLMCLVLGSDTLHEGISFLLLWVACVFVSVLIHELGHVLMGRVFGAWGEVILYGFGGLAVGSSGLSNRWKRMAVAFAGPGADFLFLGLFIVCLPLVAPQAWEYLNNIMRGLLGLPLVWSDSPPDSLLQLALVRYMFFINLIWGLVNLLPVWPLDGGHISRDFLEWLLPCQGAALAFGVSALLAGFIAVNALLQMNGRPLVRYIPIGGWWGVLLFGMLAAGSVQALQEERSRQAWTEEHLTRWDKDEDDRSWRG